MKGTISILLLFALMLSCKDDDPCGECPTPIINSIDPRYGIIFNNESSHNERHHTFVIEGENFGEAAGDNLVTFNGVQAEVLDQSSTFLEVKPAFGSDSGPVRVTVNGKNSNTNHEVTFLEGVNCEVFGLVGIENVELIGNDLSFDFTNTSTQPLNLEGLLVQLWFSSDDILGGDQPAGGIVLRYYCGISILFPGETCTFEWGFADIPQDYVIVQIKDDDLKCDDLVFAVSE